MAYFNLLASVAEAEVARLRADPKAMLQPSMVSGASHLLAYWVQVQPLGGLLARAIDGGEPLHPELWHPLRPPLFHGPAAVHELAVEVGAALAGLDLADDDWLRHETARLLRVCRHATAVGECVVSALEVPADPERAVRVQRLWLGPPRTMFEPHAKAALSDSSWARFWTSIRGRQ